MMRCMLMLLIAMPAFSANILLTLDGFTPGEENVVLFAVSQWEEWIDGPLSLQMLVRKHHFTDGTAAVTEELQSDGTGLPSHARISIDDRVNDVVPWFIDPTPELNEEFVERKVPNSWKALPGTEAFTSYDLVTVVHHELAHALGFSASFALFANGLETDENSVRRYVGAGINVPLTSPFDGTHVSDSLHGPDLMNSLLLQGQRFAPSYYDLAMLNDAFGYGMPLPTQPTTIPEPDSFSYVFLGGAIVFFRVLKSPLFSRTALCNRLPGTPVRQSYMSAADVHR